MSSISIPWVEKWSICSFRHFFQIPGFMLKYGDFENRPVSRKRLSVEQKYAYFWPPGVEREHLAALGPFFKFQISYPNITEILVVRISKTAACIAKISLITTPWGKKRVHVQLWDISSNSRFHGQIWKFKISVSISETAARTHMVEQQEAQGPWCSAWTEDPIHKNVLKSCKCYLRY